MRARRDFLGQVLPIGAATVAALKTDWLERVVSAGAAAADRPPAQIAADWGDSREMPPDLTLHRTIMHLHNAYTCPIPRALHQALEQYLYNSYQAPDQYM